MHYDMSVQEQIDRKMCKPGYTWNDTLGKCLGAGGGSGEGMPNDPALQPKPTPNDAIAMEIASRENTGEVL